MQEEYHVSDHAGYGKAINECYIDEDGKMWVTNGEYTTQVNFNPWTGKAAPYQLTGTINCDICFNGTDDVTYTTWK